MFFKLIMYYVFNRMSFKRLTYITLVMCLDGEFQNFRKFEI